uniref:Uncharacterized protein n=1 Tax=Panagrolaimus superbus TaxID=310955 RepID=A0A914YKP5_9BILA
MLKKNLPGGCAEVVSFVDSVADVASEGVDVASEGAVEASDEGLKVVVEGVPVGKYEVESVEKEVVASGIFVLLESDA